MLRECCWSVLTPVAVAEIAGRIRYLFDRRTDFTRNLHVPPEYPKHVDESGFGFAVTPAWGGHATLFHCSGSFRAAGLQTAVEVRLRLAASACWVPVGVAFFFWVVLIGGLYPVSAVLAIGSFVGLACIVMALIVFTAWYGMRACRRGIDNLLSAEQTAEVLEAPGSKQPPLGRQAPELPEVSGPKYPWWELLGAGLFSYFASGFTWWYLTHLERGPGSGQLRLPAIAARLYQWGGKWPLILLLALSGTAFSAAGLAKLIRKLRE